MFTILTDLTNQPNYFLDGSEWEVPCHQPYAVILLHLYVNFRISELTAIVAILLGFRGPFRSLVFVSVSV